MIDILEILFAKTRRISLFWLFWTSSFLSVLLFLGGVFWITTLSVSPFNWHFLSILVMVWFLVRKSVGQENDTPKSTLLGPLSFEFLKLLLKVQCRRYFAYLPLRWADISLFVEEKHFLLKKIFLLLKKIFYFLSVRFDKRNLRCRPLLNEFKEVLLLRASFCTCRWCGLGGEEGRWPPIFFLNFILGYWKTSAEEVRKNL